MFLCRLWSHNANIERRKIILYIVHIGRGTVNAGPRYGGSATVNDTNSDFPTISSQTSEPYIEHLLHKTAAFIHRDYDSTHFLIVHTSFCFCIYRKRLELPRWTVLLFYNNDNRRIRGLHPGRYADAELPVVVQVIIDRYDFSRNI